MGAEAIRSLVMGDVSPSGHTSVTFPRSVGQIPIHHDKLSACRHNEPWNKYSNRYVDEQNEPLYPFGYGLSYTTFQVDEASVSADVLTADAPVTASVRLTNTGSMAAETVVQLYARVKHSPIIRSVCSLIGWKRIALAPGESVRVELPVTAEMITVYDACGKPVPLRDSCQLAMGLDSAAEFNMTVTCK